MNFFAALLLCALATFAYAQLSCTKLSGLKTCTGVDWDVLSSTASNSTSYDNNVAAGVAALKAAGKSSDCQNSFLQFTCASVFGVCTPTSIEVACKDLCTSYASDCSVSSEVCDNLPTTDCTKNAG